MISYPDKPTIFLQNNAVLEWSLKTKLVNASIFIYKFVVSSYFTIYDERSFFNKCAVIFLG